MDGEKRCKALGRTKAHTRDKQVALDWRNAISKVNHPDICSHPKADKALAALNGLCGQMKRTAK
jgi:hypothetical protein